MKNPFSRGSKFVLYLLVALIGISLACLVGQIGILKPAGVEAKISQEAVTEDQEHALDHANPLIKAALAIQERHTPRLLANRKVIGTAVGFNEAGRLAMMVLVRDIVEAREVPESLEGLPVHIKITGEIFALACPPIQSDPKNPTATFPLPVPIGVSTGNATAKLCDTGTIAARVKDSDGKVYALSNNHVYGLENSAVPGTSVLQPGLYDAGCTTGSKKGNEIGTLSAFVPISSTSNNTVDAAIALSSPVQLCNYTPFNGYGRPNSTITTAKIFQAVQKYGRTTSLTKGTIMGLNATVYVTYDFGTAIFVNQIIVFSSRPFIKAGDSGSLLVTNNSYCYPVGLLFAGNESGTYAIANPIGPVLSSLGTKASVTGTPAPGLKIDGK